MRQEIEEALQPLIGLPFSDMMRYCGCQRFEFGEQRPSKNKKGEDITVGDWGVVASCDWRIAGPEGSVICYDDFGPGQERRDVNGPAFYDLLHKNPPYVEVIQADEKGGLLFRMTDGFILEVIPERESDPVRWAIYEECRRPMLRDGELWRFTPKEEFEGDEPDHLVVTKHGVDWPMDRRTDVLFGAIYHSNLDAVRSVLNQVDSIPCNPYDDEETVLMFAARESSLDVVRLLLDYGVGDEVSLPMVTAAESKSVEIIQWFFDRGGDVNEADQDGWTPLIQAAACGNEQIVRFLIEHGADITRQTQKGETALSLAREYEHAEVADYLLRELGTGR